MNSQTNVDTVDFQSSFRYWKNEIDFWHHVTGAASTRLQSTFSNLQKSRQFRGTSKQTNLPNKGWRDEMMRKGDGLKSNKSVNNLGQRRANKVTDVKTRRNRSRSPGGIDPPFVIFVIIWLHLLPISPCCCVCCEYSPPYCEWEKKAPSHSAI